jgi:hypothetical protein
MVSIWATAPSEVTPISPSPAADPFDGSKERRIAVFRRSVQALPSLLKPAPVLV